MVAQLARRRVNDFAGFVVAKIKDGGSGDERAAMNHQRGRNFAPPKQDAVVAIESREGVEPRLFTRFEGDVAE